MSTTRNPNAARKIARAIRAGWHRGLYYGPCRFLRLNTGGRRRELRACAQKADNRWRPSPVQKEAEAA